VPGTRAAPRPEPRTVPALGEDAVMAMITPGARARQSRRLLVYVHVPFCASKCHFCDWVVGYDKDELLDRGSLRERYVDALCTQIRSYGTGLSRLGYVVTNVYWGGGTPTRLTPEQLRQIQRVLRKTFDLSEVGEYTAECSPETLTERHLEELLEGGLNRISIGVQSFDDSVLRRMGRAHDARGAFDAIELVRRAGLPNYNIDLITGFPEQSAESVLDSVRHAIELVVPHISLYMFREFAEDLVAVRQVRSSKRRQATREERAAVYMHAKALLESAGYDEYMVGYYAREPRFRFDGESYYFGMAGDFVGFGAGASSTLGRCALRSGEPSRYGNADVRRFIEQPLALAAAPLALIPDDVFTSVTFKAFATPGGIRFARWLDHFGFSFTSFRDSRPGIRKWFHEQEQRGARFIETEHGIALTPETRAKTMIWRQ
jgi:putative oxygen-independent coproporphyrinogen III oxidase